MKARLHAILSTTLITLGSFTAILYTSCQQNKCNGIVCAYQGTCNNGVCTCLPGYEGPQCETVNADRYVDTWQVDEDGTLSNETFYSVTIQAGPAANQVRINGMRGFFTQPVVATIQADTMTIYTQIINGYTIQGTGRLTNSTKYGDHGELDVRYSVKDPSGQTDDFGLDTGKVSIWHK